MTVGSIPLFLAYIDMLISPIDWLVELSDKVNKWTPRSKKMFDMIVREPNSRDSKTQNNESQEKEQGIVKAKNLPEKDFKISLQNAIKFDNVSFCYLSNVAALNAVTFSIPKG